MSTYCLRNFPDSPIRRPWFMNHSITTYVGRSTDGSCGVKHQHKININSSDSRTSVGYMHKKHHTLEWVNDEKPQSKPHIKPREPIGAFSTNSVPKIGHRRPNPVDTGNAQLGHSAPRFLGLGLEEHLLRNRKGSTDFCGCRLLVFYRILRTQLPVCGNPLLYLVPEYPRGHPGVHRITGAKPQLLGLF